MEYDVAIIGSGPAGLSTAVYLKRAMLRVAVIEKEYFPGGQMLFTESIDNYLGFENISGFDLSQKFRKHAENLGAEFIAGTVKSLQNGKIILNDGTKITAKAAVIASGASHKKLNVKGENEFSGKGVSYCATCDGAYFKGKNAVVIGGGDTALEDAIYLSNICSKVTLIHRRNEFRAKKFLVSSFEKLENTEIIFNEEIESVNGDKAVQSVTLKSGKTVLADAVFVAVGQKANTDFIKDVTLADDGSVVTDERCKTNVDEIFAVGDVRQKYCRQVVTAVSDGAIASKSVCEYLSKKES